MASLLDLLSQTWPARMGQAAWQAFKAPGDAYAGRLDPLSDEGIGRATDLAGMVMGGTYATAPRGAMGAGPIKAYHGSPYDFERFDLSRIGTGEGAQAYGHGLYFAENPGVAETYKGTNPAVTWQGKSVSRDEAADQLATLLKKPPPEISGRHADEARLVGLLRPDAQPYNAAKLITDWASVGMTPDKMRRRIMDGAWSPDVKQQLFATVNAAEGKMAMAPGRMYEVNIRAEPQQFLDWDKALREMGPSVQATLGERYSPHMSGAQIYESARLVPGQYRNPVVATENLREAGIPGIKYLDQGSRGGGQGTSNYVLFRDDIIDIVRKYGWAGLAAFGISEEQAKEAGVDRPKTRIGNKTYEM